MTSFMSLKMNIKEKMCFSIFRRGVAGIMYKQCRGASPYDVNREENKRHENKLQKLGRN
jgi:hypothetical protein